MSGSIRRIQTIQPKVWYTDLGQMYRTEDIDPYLMELAARRTESKRIKKELNDTKDSPPQP